MIKRVLSGILAVVLLPLGLTFVVLGLVLEDDGSGDKQGFLGAGIPLVLAGLALAGVFLLLRRREADRRRRRREGSRAPAEIVRAHFLAGVRVGALLAYDLTVSFPAAGTVTRRVFVIPGTELIEGETIEVLYDPAEPDNFEPAGQPR